MAEYIDKWSVVNRLIDIENEFQRHKPFHGFGHAMYRKICETEIAIGKTPAADVEPVVRCRECKHCDPETHHCDHHMGTVDPLRRKPDDFCSYGERKEGDD